MRTHGLLAFVALILPLAVGAKEFHVQAHGKFVCRNNGVEEPLAFARVELMDSDSDTDTIPDDLLGFTYTNANGEWATDGIGGDSGDWSWSRPDVYARVILSDDMGPQGVRLTDELNREQSFATPQHDHDNAEGDVDIGTWWWGTDAKGDDNASACGVWLNSRRAFTEYQALKHEIPPAGHYDIEYWAGVWAGEAGDPTPWTNLDTTHWPRHYHTGKVSAHEFAHSVRHSLDGDGNHFNWDVTRFWYAQHHHACTNIDHPSQGFAFNEGWAEWWAGQVTTFCGAVPNFADEGDVAGGLAELEGRPGVDRLQMLAVLHDNPGAIHNFQEFCDKLEQRVPGSCVGAMMSPLTVSAQSIPETALSRAAQLRGMSTEIEAQKRAVAILERTLAMARRRAAAQRPACSGEDCQNAFAALTEPAFISAEIHQHELAMRRLEALINPPREATGFKDRVRAELQYRQGKEQYLSQLREVALSAFVQALQSTRELAHSHPAADELFAGLARKLDAAKKAASERAQTPAGWAPLFLSDELAGRIAAHVPEGSDSRLNNLPPAGLYLTIDAVAPTELKQNNASDVTYTIWNNTFAPEHGQLSGEVLNQHLHAAPGGPSLTIDLPPQGKQTGHLITSKLVYSGFGSIELRYIGQLHCVQIGPPEEFKRSCEAGSGAHASQSILVALDPSTLKDDDHDGIPDLVEDALLARHRPYLFYTAEDEYRPIDAWDYITKSELRRNPNEDDDGGTHYANSVLGGDPLLVFKAHQFGNGDCTGAISGDQLMQCSSNILIWPALSWFYINPLEQLDWIAGENLGRHGSDWQSVETSKNIGLYGHVAPIHLLNPRWSCDTRWNTVSPPQAEPLNAPLYYKVEYWQLFGFNDSGSWGIGKHEGDWINVSLLIGPVAPGVHVGDDSAVDFKAYPIVAVMIYAHAIEWRFDIPPSPAQSVPLDADFVEWQGPNARWPVAVASGVTDDQCSPFVEVGQQNRLRMFRDPETGEFVHPVAYAEKGAHELWPTAGGWWVGAASHDGAGPHHFLTSTPPNVGEVEHPRPQFPKTLPVLLFNGKWGAWSSSKGDPPQGPPLHDQWTYPPCIPTDLYRHCKVGPAVTAVHHGY